MLSTLTCSVFELKHRRESPSLSKNYDDMSHLNREFLERFNFLAKSEDLKLQYQLHPFQHLRLNEPFRLKNSEFDADIAICMYPDLTMVGSEIAELMMDREKAYRHVFFITQKNVSDQKEGELWNGIRILPQATVQREYSFLEPIPFQMVNGEDCYDAEKSRKMSHWHVLQIHCDDSRKRMQTILALA